MKLLCNDPSCRMEHLEIEELEARIAPESSASYSDGIGGATTDQSSSSFVD